MPTETEPNKFVEGFLVPLQPQLDIFYEVDSEIALERLSWQSSGAAEEIIDGFAAALDGIGQKHHLNDPKQRKNAIASTQFQMFGGQDIDGRAVNEVNQIIRRSLSPAGQRIHKEFAEKTLEHRGAFKAAVAPLVQERRELVMGLITNWQEFMVISTDHFAAFAQFLSAEDLIELRVVHRPFIQALQQSSPAIIDDAAKKLMDGMMEEPTPDVVSGFIDTSFVLAGKDGAIRDWLILLSQSADTIDPDEVAQRIATAKLLPRDLRQPFTNFLYQSVSPLVRDIKDLLVAYRIQAPKVSIRYTGFQQVTKRRGPGRQTIVTNASAKIKTEGQLEIEERPGYEIMIIQRGEPVPLTGKLRERYITDTANRFRPNDHEMKDDIQKIIDSLQDDPYGLGVRKLTDKTTPSLLDYHSPAPLRRYRADQRPNVNLSLSESKILRVVYHFDNRAYPSTIFLDEVLDHGEFDTKYTK